MIVAKIFQGLRRRSVTRVGRRVETRMPPEERATRAATIRRVRRELRTGIEDDGTPLLTEEHFAPMRRYVKHEIRDFPEAMIVRLVNMYCE